MSEQEPVQTATTRQDEPNNGEPSSERQAELEACYVANQASGKAPYHGVPIRSAGELQWIYRMRGWSPPLHDATLSVAIDSHSSSSSIFEVFASA